MAKLSFIDKVHEGDSVYTFRFNKPANFTHNAGQHCLFILPGLYRPHPFTLSSAPEEEFISFSTRIREGSRFKQRLMQLGSGDSIFMVGPLLNYTLKPNHTNYTFLAQGIGITPFRSMLVHARAANLPLVTTLIHVDKGAHPFKDLTSQYATHAHYPATSQEFREIVTKQNSNQLFYISGSPRFNRETKKFLKKLGVSSKNIKTDSFLGY